MSTQSSVGSSPKVSAIPRPAPSLRPVSEHVPVEMHPDDSQTPKRRPRAGTKTTFPSILKPRKSEPSPATPTTPPSNDEPPTHMPLEDLIEALTPPAVLSLGHARALILVLQTETPRLDVLMPVVSRLCAPGVPSPFLGTGLDIISVYAASHAHPTNDVERASLFSILRSSDPHWTPETWMPRYKCLVTLSREGRSVEGFATPFLDYAKHCITSAFESLLSDDDSDTTPREKYIESISHIMRKTLTQSASLYTEKDFQDGLEFFEGFVQRSLADVQAGLLSEITSIPSSPGVTPIAGFHRRNASSASGPIPYPGTRPPPIREPMSPLDRTLLPSTLYIAFLDMYRPHMASSQLPAVVSLLVRIVSVHLSPLPRLSTSPTPQHHPRPAEEAALKQLFALLSGPYADTVAGHMKHLLASANPQEALGSFRTVRAVLRDAAGSRMALLALNKPKYEVDEFAPSGQLIVTEALVGVLERAHKEGFEVPSLTLDRLAKWVGKAVCEWAVRSDAEKVLEEALGIVKDIMAEASDRGEEREDYSALDVHEGRFVGTVLSEAVKYVQRMRSAPDFAACVSSRALTREHSMSQKTSFLPIDKPSSAPTPLLLALCTQLALPLSTPMTPSLPSILLSITSHLTDAQTASIPPTMQTLGLLTPTSPAWLDNLTDLFNALVGRDRPLTSREVLSVTQTIHTDLMGVPAYRRQLGRRVCELAEQTLEREEQDSGAGLDGDESWFRLCANELVWRILESVQREGDETSAEEDDGEDLTERIIAVCVRHTEGACPCTTVDTDDIPPLPHSPSQDSTMPSTPGMSLPSSNSGTPILSRVASDYPVQDKDVQSPPPTSGSVLPPLMSMLPGWTMPRNSRDQEVPASPMTIRSDTEGPPREHCRPLGASIALVNVFQDLSFAAPPQAAHSVRLFKVLLSVLSNAKCPRARLAILQLLMRLRADRDHRLYVLNNLDDDIHTLAVLVDRSRVTSRETPSDDGDLQRARSTSRGLRRGRARSSAGSRSRSRPAPPVLTVPTRSKPRGPLWMVPESLPFDIPVSEPSSEGITTYEANAPTELEESKHWLPVSDYVFALIDILRSETDWDILSYVLCHLPVQLANKHFFCGPKTKDGILGLLTTLCTVTFKGESANAVAERMPESLRLRDAQGLVCHTLAVLVSYRTIFDERKHHDMLVEAFLSGLSSQPSTVKFCLNALSICAFEFPSSITKNLSHILEKLSRIMTNAAMAVHILDFVSIVGSLPSLYANFREQEFKMVFAVAVTYIHHHNSPDTRGLSGRESFALSQHVLVIAYYIIYVWFLAVALPDRPNHVEFLTRRLMLANEAKGAVDEPTEVCFDWLARYTYATADPRPAYSLLGDIVMNPPRRENDESAESPLSSKTWIWGNSLVTISTLPKRGWIEVESVRPSGETRFLCKLENLPQVNPGDVDPDRLTDAAIMMADRDPTEMEKNIPDPDDDQSRDATTEDAAQRVREIFVPPDPPDGEEERPDPVTGYVWSESAPSQRRKEVSIDPSFFALQLSQYPNLPKATARSQLVSSTPHLDSLLRTLKHTPVIDTHKIAILYVAPGQTIEREILGNRHGSPAYTRFLEGMGRLIRVRDQRDVYTGDIVPESDGEYAYAWWDDIVQVVYHTATLMPNLAMDPNFMYKKRHVGNDKVRIVWNDSGLPYAQDAIPSAFNFVNLIIEPHSIGTIAAFSDNRHEHEFFKVTMQRMDGMPEFGPIGDYKLVSAENLAPLLRQVSLLANFFSEVYEATDKDTSTYEYVTNWRRRLQYINTFRKRLESEPLPERAEDQEVGGLRDVRDFTRFF